MTMYNVLHTYREMYVCWMLDPIKYSTQAHVSVKIENIRIIMYNNYVLLCIHTFNKQLYTNCAKREHDIYP